MDEVAPVRRMRGVRLRRSRVGPRTAATAASLFGSDGRPDEGEMQVRQSQASAATTTSDIDREGRHEDEAMKK